MKIRAIPSQKAFTMQLGAGPAPYEMESRSDPGRQDLAKANKERQK